MVIPTSSGTQEINGTVTSAYVNVALPLSGREWEVWIRAFNSNGSSGWIYEAGVSPSN